jgi:Zn-dependent peptidase ImmA (M78 family)
MAYLGYRQDSRIPPAGPMTGRWVDQGRELARRALHLVGKAGRNPAGERDLAKLVEEVFHVDVSVVELPGGFDGLSHSSKDANLIVVGTSRVPTRQRFTVAHELGHLFAQDNQGVHLDQNLYDSAHKKQPSEIRANAFAAEFLLPEETLRATADGVAQSEVVFAKLVCQMWVSPSTLAYRLLNLGLIDQQLCDRYKKMNGTEAAQLSGVMDRLAEWVAASSSKRLPVGLLQATLQAYQDGKATLRPFANLLGVDVTALRQALGQMREELPQES